MRTYTGEEYNMDELRAEYHLYRFLTDTYIKLAIFCEKYGYVRMGNDMMDQFHLCHAKTVRIEMMVNIKGE